MNPSVVLNLQTSRHASEHQHGTRRVLLVMRKSSERNQAVAALKKAGYDVVSHDNCHDALRYCRQTITLDVLVAETEVPSMWGLELARVASVCHPEMAVICVGKSDPKPHVQRELTDRGWNWAPKVNPFDSVLIEKVQSCLLH